MQKGLGQQFQQGGLVVNNQDGLDFFAGGFVRRRMASTRREHTGA